MTNRYQINRSLNSVLKKIQKLGEITLGNVTKKQWDEFHALHKRRIDLQKALAALPLAIEKPVKKPKITKTPKVKKIPYKNGVRATDKYVFAKIPKEKKYSMNCEVVNLSRHINVLNTMHGAHSEFVEIYFTRDKLIVCRDSPPNLMQAC